MNHTDTIALAGHFEIISLSSGKEAWRSPIMPNRILNGGAKRIVSTI